MLLYSIADIEGPNQRSRQVITNAALATVGMVANDPDAEPADRPTIGSTTFGVTTLCVQTARGILVDRGYETIVFHAAGTGSRAIESPIDEGIVDGVLDVTTTECASEFVGGVLGAGQTRLDAAGNAGIPQVVSTGALDTANFGPRDSIPAEFEGCQFHIHNPQVTLVRTTPEENAEFGQITAEKPNAAAGPTAPVLPLGGVSTTDVEGNFHDPEADEALFDALWATVDTDVELIEMETDINDDASAGALATTVDEYVRETERGPSA